MLENPPDCLLVHQERVADVPKRTLSDEFVGHNGEANLRVEATNMITGW